MRASSTHCRSAIKFKIVWRFVGSKTCEYETSNNNGIRCCTSTISFTISNNKPFNFGNFFCVFFPNSIGIETPSKAAPIRLCNFTYHVRTCWQSAPQYRKIIFKCTQQNSEARPSRLIQLKYYWICLMRSDCYNTLFEIYSVDWGYFWVDSSSFNLYDTFRKFKFMVLTVYFRIKHWVLLPLWKCLQKRCFNQVILILTTNIRIF